MKSLRIINSTKDIRRDSENCITENAKLLYLSRAKYKGFHDNYDEYFDELNSQKQIYDKLETLIIESDSINEVPDNVLKFKNLKKLNVRGSRFCHLQLLQVPESIEVLILTEHSNLPLYCLNGMDKLINLTQIYLDMEPFYFSNIFDENDNEIDISFYSQQIPDLPKLKIISFHSGRSFEYEDLKPNWIDILKNNHLFSHIKDRIINVLFDNINMPQLTIILNK